MKYSEEQLYVIKSFEDNFKSHRDKRIAIYGVGQNTKAIVEEFNDYNIMGLLDEVSVGSVVFGKPVITIQEAIDLNVEMIIIVARSGNVPIIFRRIDEKCRVAGISVFDISGNAIKSYSGKKKNLNEYRDISKGNLIGKINQCDVVSFDVFDTLIMRTVLYPRDIFSLAQQHSYDGFSKDRIEAEQSFYLKNINPTIKDIYEKLPLATMDAELALESEHLIAREEMCKVLKYAKDSGKEVYAVSDMYLPKEYIFEIFNDLNIDINANNIIVSCDYNVSKANGLFLKLRERVGNKKILHIGDNLEADIYAAKKYGIDSTFQVKSSLKMLEDSAAVELLKHDNTLANRLIIGDIISKQLNDPFIFSGAYGKFKSGSPYILSYCFIAPLIYNLFVWMNKKAQEQGIDIILLSARDGFLMDKIYNKLSFEKIPLVKMSYFYISRSIAVLAGIKDVDDIVQASRLAFSGDSELMLQKRFRLKKDVIKKREKRLSDIEYILLHQNEIFAQVCNAKTNYNKYLRNFNIDLSTKVGFFDFVASGTCQKFLDNIVDWDVYGLYCVRLNAILQYKKHIKIESMYDRLSAMDSSYSILKQYIFLENVITAPHPSVDLFDADGKPLFLIENRSKVEVDELTEMQTAIIDYCVNNYHKLYGENISLDLCDNLLKFLDKEYISDMDYSIFKLMSDEFSNRKDTVN